RLARIGARHYAGSYADDGGSRTGTGGGSFMRVLMGWMVASMMVVAAACATPPVAPPGVDGSGSWAGGWGAFEGEGGGGELRGVFRQDGATLYGNFEWRGRTVSRTFVSGTVRGNEVFLAAPVQGMLVVDGDEMNGTAQGIVAAKITLRRQ